MKTTFIPPLSEIAPAKPTPLPLAQELTLAINHNARTLGTPGWDAVPLPGTPIIGSGHQAWFWHPGILIKDLTAASLAKKRQGQAFHIVVDHDEHPACTIDVPVQEGSRVTVKQLTLGIEKPGLSSLNQKCIPLQTALDNIDAFILENPSAGPLLAGLKDAVQSVHNRSLSGQITPQNLAHQVTAILDQLRKSIALQLPVLFASQLARMSGFQSLLQQVLADPVACAQAYNTAVAQHPDAGIAPLSIMPQKVEVPFWTMSPGTDAGATPRVKAFAEHLTTGWSIANFSTTTSILLPRALTMTGLLRSQACHLFIHGKGGGLYDQITESWWTTWTGKTLNPKAVASADLYLPFDVPRATPKDVTQALWEAHAIPHNIDRARSQGSPLVIEKGQILARMAQTKDVKQRAALFLRLHQVNHALASKSPDLLQSAQLKLQNARDGVINAQTLARRDWCFAFYSNEQLTGLSTALA